MQLSWNLTAAREISRGVFALYMLSTTIIFDPTVTILHVADKLLTNTLLVFR